MYFTTPQGRYRGALVGTLVGDAMGAPVEWQTPEYVAEYFAKIGGYHLHDYQDPWAIRRGKKPTTVLAGQPTDDSELAAALAQSLALNPELDAADLYGRLRSFIHDRKAILSNRAYGQGGTLKAALEPSAYEESVAKFAAGEIPTPPSNGSLMRNVATALAMHPFSDKVADLSRRQSLVTHRNDLSVAACVAFGLLMNQMLGGIDTVNVSWMRTVSMLKQDYLAGMPALAEVLAIPLTKPDYETEMKEREGYVILSLRVALWAAAEATDFADGIIRAISVGGDTDTYAAIAGGILGARFGIEGIPSSWVEQVQGREAMIELADRLLVHTRS